MDKGLRIKPLSISTTTTTEVKHTPGATSGATSGATPGAPIISPRAAFSKLPLAEVAQIEAQKAIRAEHVRKKQLKSAARTKKIQAEAWNPKKKNILTESNLPTRKKRVNKSRDETPLKPSEFGPLTKKQTEYENKQKANANIRIQNQANAILKTTPHPTIKTITSVDNAKAVILHHTKNLQPTVLEIQKIQSNTEKQLKNNLTKQVTEEFKSNPNKKSYTNSDITAEVTKRLNNTNFTTRLKETVNTTIKGKVQEALSQSIAKPRNVITNSAKMTSILEELAKIKPGAAAEAAAAAIATVGIPSTVTAGILESVANGIGRATDTIGKQLRPLLQQNPTTVSQSQVTTAEKPQKLTAESLVGIKEANNLTKRKEKLDKIKEARKKYKEEQEKAYEAYIRSGKASWFKEKIYGAKTSIGSIGRRNPYALSRVGEAQEARNLSAKETKLVNQLGKTLQQQSAESARSQQNKLSALKVNSQRLSNESYNDPGGPPKALGPAEAPKTPEAEAPKTPEAEAPGPPKKPETPETPFNFNTTFTNKINSLPTKPKTQKQKGPPGPPGQPRKKKTTSNKSSTTTSVTTTTNVILNSSSPGAQQYTGIGVRPVQPATNAAGKQAALLQQQQQQQPAAKQAALLQQQQQQQEQAALLQKQAALLQKQAQNNTAATQASEKQAVTTATLLRQKEQEPPQQKLKTPVQQGLQPTVLTAKEQAKILATAATKKIKLIESNQKNIKKENVDIIQARTPQTQPATRQQVFPTNSKGNVIIPDKTKLKPTTNTAIQKKAETDAINEKQIKLLRSIFAQSKILSTEQDKYLDTHVSGLEKKINTLPIINQQLAANVIKKIKYEQQIVNVFRKIDEEIKNFENKNPQDINIEYLKETKEEIIKQREEELFEYQNAKQNGIELPKYNPMQKIRSLVTDLDKLFE
jgi:hypothetical protein